MPGGLPAFRFRAGPAVKPAGLLAAAALWAALPAHSADLQLSIELPRLKHRPYVAVWMENAQRERVADLALWHEARKERKKRDEGRDEERAEGKKGKKKDKDKGDKYLPDLRQWWRTGGKELQLPIDGVTGPTRPGGTHALRFASGTAPLGNLQAGAYKLYVEVAREDGGDETLSFPLAWPPRSAQQQQQRGNVEVGEVTVSVKP